MDKIAKILGVRLKELRQRGGLSQADLAFQLKVTASSINLLESGQRKPSLKMLISISRFFKVTTDYLVGFDDNERICIDDDVKILLTTFSSLQKKERECLILIAGDILHVQSSSSE